jgi:hypothetical protein
LLALLKANEMKGPHVFDLQIVANAGPRSEQDFHL